MIDFRKLFAVLLIFSAANVFAQNTNNTRTKKHLYLPGSRVYMVPPDGFLVSKDFSGLEKNGRSKIQIYDLPGTNYKTDAPDLKKAYEQDGAVIFDHQEITFDGYPAQFLYLQNQPGIKTCCLMFGDSTFSCMALASFPSKEKDISEDIKKSLFSIYYDKNVHIDPYAIMPFTLDESKSVFKYAKTSDGNMLYSQGGKIKKVYQNEPIVLVTTTPNTVPSADPRRVAQVLIDEQKKAGYRKTELRNDTLLTIDGFPAFEAEVYGLQEGKIRLIYQLVIMGKEKGVVIEGITTQGFEENLSEFRKLARSIKLKK